MRVLFLTHRLPYAPNRGDRVRAFHILRVLAGHMDVDLVSLVHDSSEEAHAAEMTRRGLSVTTARVPRLRNLLTGLPALATASPLTHVLLSAPQLNAVLHRLTAERPPDVVLAYCSGMARFALEPPLRGRPFVLDMVDVDSSKWASLAATAGYAKRWIFSREARQLAAFEALASRQAVETLVVNERERDALATLAPDAPIRVVPNGVDVQGLRPTSPPGDALTVVFCGVMNYIPNVQAVEWFVSRSWPAVRAAVPVARLLVVGSEPAASIRALAANDPSIIVTGSVPDVRPHLWNAAVSIAPIMTARGIQNKVLEAVAAGLPCVVTTAVLDGLPPEVRPACRVADSAEAFAEAVVRLLSVSPGERRAIAERGDLSSRDWDTALAAIPDVLARALTTTPGERPPRVPARQPPPAQRTAAWQ